MYTENMFLKMNNMNKWHKMLHYKKTHVTNYHELNFGIITHGLGQSF